MSDVAADKRGPVARPPLDSLSETRELPPDDALTAASEELAERGAADAAQRIKRGQHWHDWMVIAEGLEVGRNKAMRRAGTNRPVGAAYNKAFGAWLKEHEWARDLDPPTRHSLFWCLDHRSVIEAWRQTLSQNERARLNHPTVTKRRFEATHKVAEAKGAALQRVAHEQEVVRLKADIAMREHEIEWLKNKPLEDGSLFDIAKTKPDQIARITIENVGLARTRAIRNALTQAIEAAERKAREKSKQAG
jgi:hypothetical protein